MILNLNLTCVPLLHYYLLYGTIVFFLYCRVDYVIFCLLYNIRHMRGVQNRALHNIFSLHTKEPRAVIYTEAQRLFITMLEIVSCLHGKV